MGYGISISFFSREASSFFFPVETSVFVVVPRYGVYRLQKVDLHGIELTGYGCVLVKVFGGLKSVDGAAQR